MHDLLIVPTKLMPLHREFCFLTVLCTKKKLSPSAENFHMRTCAFPRIEFIGIYFFGLSESVAKKKTLAITFEHSER